MQKDDYKIFVETYMNELNITYITVIQYIFLKQIKELNAKIILIMNKHF